MPAGHTYQSRPSGGDKPSPWGVRGVEWHAGGVSDPRTDRPAGRQVARSAGWGDRAAGTKKSRGFTHKNTDNAFTE